MELAFAVSNARGDARGDVTVVIRFKKASVIFARDSLNSIPRAETRGPDGNLLMFGRVTARQSKGGGGFLINYIASPSGTSECAEFRLFWLFLGSARKDRCNEERRVGREFTARR